MKSLLKRLARPFRRSAPIPAGQQFARNWSAPPLPAGTAPPGELEAWFDAHREGRGIWKWRHYFEIYQRHFARFVGRAPVIVEIGIYSGGSLDLWRHYFGPDARIVGVDIEPACKAYEGAGVSVVIGDQGSPAFWRDALTSGAIPTPDIVIDDGSHIPEHQRVTLESLLPALAPGGVYLCEDIHKRGNPFAAFVASAADELNATLAVHAEDSERRSVVPCSPFQSAIHSIHLYPFCAVIEKRANALPELVAPKHGTQWQPFLS